MPQMMPVQQQCPEWPAMPYQQAVQLPKRPTGWGVIADTPVDKTTPMGGMMQDHGRPVVRGQGCGSHSISHPRGVPEMASAQPQHQEGGLPSGLMPNGSLPLPPPVPERTQPWWGGQTRSALRDPMWLVANFHSSGWRKDLEHILRVYYWYSVDYFTEGDWSQVKEQFFDLFLYGLHPGPLLPGHRPPFGWPRELHPVDQEGELLSWGSSSSGMPPGVPTPGGSPLAQMASGGSQ